MSYCTQADLLEQMPETELIDLTDDEGLGVVDTNAVTRACADADAEIDGYCAARYTVPFSPVPVMIRKIAVDQALYNLFSRRGDVIPELRQKRYENAVRFLRDVAKGVITLGADAPLPDTDGGPEATAPRSDRTFTIGRSSNNTTGTLDNY